MLAEPLLGSDHVRRKQTENLIHDPSKPGSEPL
jgi:hypothetical protein